MSPLLDALLGALSLGAVGASTYAFVIRPKAKRREAEEKTAHAKELARLKQIAEYHASRAELAESEVAKNKRIER